MNEKQMSEFFEIHSKKLHLHEGCYINLENIYQAFKTRLISECYLGQIFEKDNQGEINNGSVV